jgi:hypothetical protein
MAGSKAAAHLVDCLEGGSRLVAGLVEAAEEVARLPQPLLGLLHIHPALLARSPSGIAEVVVRKTRSHGKQVNSSGFPGWRGPSSILEQGDCHQLKDLHTHTRTQRIPPLLLHTTLTPDLSECPELCYLS